MSDSYFAFDVWVQGSPTPGTSAIVVDAVGPGVDSAEPAASRIITVGKKRGGTVIMGSGALTLVGNGGTSLAYQVWYYDSVLAKWIKWPNAGATTMTIATLSVHVITLRNMNGAKFYVQITAVTGTVTEFGYDFT